MIPNTNDVLKQGYLYKKSKYIGQWRLRWTILTDKYLYTFKNKNIHRNPTEIIQLSTIDSVLSSSDKIFQIALENTANNNNNYAFKADEKSDKIEWMDHINKFRNKCIKIPINIECSRDKAYNDHFELVIPYDANYPYCINSLISDIMAYMHKKYDLIKFIATKIKSNSFIQQEIVYYDYDWTNSTTSITNYDKIILKQIGIYLEIDIDIYKHNTESCDIICDDMKSDKDLCPIYAKMRYQDIFSEKYLNHLYEYKHVDDVECKHGDQCYAY
eukprot:166034_1